MVRFYTKNEAGANVFAFQNITNLVFNKIRVCRSKFALLALYQKRAQGSYFVLERTQPVKSHETPWVSICRLRSTATGKRHARHR